MIQPVENNIEKQQTYAKQLGRYKLAMRNDFFFEAMMIVYAMLEDRLNSYLYYIGAYDNRKIIKISKRTKKYLLEIVSLYEKGDKQIRLRTDTITGKMKIVEATLKWVEDVTNVQDKYLVELKNELEGIDVGGLLITIDEIKDWLKYRNEIVHASMNKNIDCLYESLKLRVEDGMEYARFLDNQVKILKKSNNVRKKMNMGDK